MRKLAAALATFTIVTAGLAASAGPASATSHWTGKNLGNVKHVTPLRSEVWS
jgi:hypothetical protein